MCIHVTNLIPLLPSFRCCNSITGSKFANNNSAVSYFACCIKILYAKHKNIISTYEHELFTLSVVVNVVSSHEDHLC